jgi:hypothetical protein
VDSGQRTIAARPFTEADVAHIAGEIEDLGKRHKPSIAGVRIPEHKVKLDLCPARIRIEIARAGSSRSCINRSVILTLLKESFVPLLPAIIPEAYRAAIRVVRSAYPFEAPPECPWSGMDIIGG